MGKDDFDFDDDDAVRQQKREGEEDMLQQYSLVLVVVVRRARNERGENKSRCAFFCHSLMKRSTEKEARNSRWSPYPNVLET